MTRFEEMLRLYMSVHGISQRQLARELDMSPSTINRILKGKNCEIRNLWILAEWLMEPIFPGGFESE